MRPYLIAMEIQPAVTASTFNLAYEGIKSVINWGFVSPIDIVIYVINIVVLPTSWMLETFVAKLIYATVRVFGTDPTQSAAGVSSLVSGVSSNNKAFESSFRNTGERFLSVVDDPFRGRALQEALIYLEPDVHAIRFVESTAGSVFYVAAIVSDVAVIAWEITLEVVKVIGFAIIRLLRMVALGATCLNSGPAVGCFVADFVLNIFEDIVRGIVGLIPGLNAEEIIGDFPSCGVGELPDIPCQCAEVEGGIFDGLLGCDNTPSTCFSKIVNGQEVWYFTDPQLGYTKRAANKDVCTQRRGTLAVDRFLGVERRKMKRMLLSDDGIIDEDKSGHPGCSKVCIRHGDTSRWMVEFCGEKQYFHGTCSKTTHKVEIPVQFMSKDQVRSHMSSFRKVFKDKILDIPGPGTGWGTRDRKKSKEEREQIFDLTLMESLREALHKQEGPAGMNCDVFKKKGEDAPEVTFETILLENVCLVSKVLKMNNYFLPKKKEGYSPVRDKDIDGMMFSPTMQYARVLQTHIGPIVESALDSDVVFKKKTSSFSLIDFRDQLKSVHTTFMRMRDPSYKPRDSVMSTMVEAHTMFVNGASVVRKTIDSHQDGIEKTRRMLARALEISQVDNLGIVSGFCKADNLCPDGTCVEDVDRDCKVPTQLTTSVLIRYPAYLAMSGLKAIDLRVLFDNAITCWSYILQNPDTNPANNIVAYYAGNFKIPANVHLCLGLAGPLPQLPLIGWSFEEALVANCATDATEINPVARCSCPQYGNSIQRGLVDTVRELVGQGQVTYYLSVLQTNGYWIPGVQFTVFQRLLRGYRWFQYLWTRITPVWVSTAWQFVVGFFCTPNIGNDVCNEVTFIFNAAYADGGMTAGQNAFCLVVMFGSLYFTLGFLLLVMLLYFFWFRVILDVINFVLFIPRVLVLAFMYNMASVKKTLRLMKLQQQVANRRFDPEDTKKTEVATPLIEGGYP